MLLDFRPQQKKKKKSITTIDYYCLSLLAVTLSLCQCASVLLIHIDFCFLLAYTFLLSNYFWPACPLLVSVGIITLLLVYIIIDWSNLTLMLPVSSGLSRSLESVLSGHRPRAHTVGVVRVDQQGKLMPPVMAAQSVVMQQDLRRFSEASIAVPPPRPPPPNFKRLNLRTQRRPPGNQAPVALWATQVIPSPPTQPQPQQPQPPPTSNLTKMAPMARSTPMLDDQTDARERYRERDRAREERREKPHVQSTRDGLITQVRRSLRVLEAQQSFPFWF